MDRGPSTALAETKQAIDHATNNVAEYRGLLAGLDDALRVGATEAAVFLDSKLLVEQMSGRWKVKHPDLIELHAQARKLAARFERISYTWIPRDRNSYADRLANEAMDAAAANDPAGEPERPQPSRENRCGAIPAGTRLDRSPRYTDQAAVAATRPDRAVGAAPLFRPRQPGAHRSGSPAGHAAARYLAQRGGISAVFASPLQRAYDTAARAAKALGLDVTVDDDLIETDFGAWEGLTFGEAAQRDPELHGRWLRDTGTTPPGGESFDDVLDRVVKARERIIAAHQCTTVLVVSHVTPIKMLLRLALEAGPGILYRLHLDLASLSIAEFYSDGASSVRLVNQTGYL